MGDQNTTTSSQANGTPAAGPVAKERNIKRQLITVGILVGLTIVGWLVGSAVLPRWWAQRIGDIVDSRLLFGSVFGIGVGAVFAILPLMALRAGWKFRAGWKRWFKFVVGALILAAPNLATLGIVMGSGNAAHAGERIMDVDAPGFRGGSLVGAIGGLVVVLLMSFVLRSRRRSKKKTAELEAKLDGLTSD